MFHVPLTLSKRNSKQEIDPLTVNTGKSLSMRSFCLHLLNSPHVCVFSLSLSLSLAFISPFSFSMSAAFAFWYCSPFRLFSPPTF